MKNYEAMFILEPTISAKEWDKASGEIEQILKKHGATIISIDKWGERKLTYPIRKNNRGTYVLTYFQAPSDAISKIYVDCQLSDIILRVLILVHIGEVKKVAVPESFAISREEDVLTQEVSNN